MSLSLDKQILSDITVYTKYAKYVPSKERRETWEELVTRNMEMHVSKFPQMKESIEQVYKNFVFNKKVLNIKYTPDFIGYDFIIETKGRANDSFPLRWKMFKYLMTLMCDNRTLYKPQSQKECDTTIELILKNRKQ